MKPTFLIFLLLSYFVSSFAFTHYDELLEKESLNDTCSSSSDCSNHGECKDGSCSCETFYSGKFCSYKWSDNNSWSIAFIIYGVYATILQFICLVYALHDLFITVRYYNEGGWSKWTLTTYIHILGAIAALFRVVNFAIDPHAERGILPRAAEVLLFQIPVLLWGCVMFMILLYWIELQGSTGIKQLLFITKLRPVLIALVIIQVLFLFPLNLWTAFSAQPFVYTVYNGFLIVIFLTLVIGLTASGIHLIRVLKTTFAVTHKKMDRFLQKLLRYIIILDVFFIALIATLVIFTVTEAQYKPALYIALHWILRTEEFTVVMATLVFTRKEQASKKPNFQTSESSVPSARPNTKVASSSFEGSKKDKEQEQSNEIEMENPSPV